MVVNVWDWRNGCRVASNKMSFNVSAISFTRDGSYFVAAGNRLDMTGYCTLYCIMDGRHLKFWYLSSPRPSTTGTVPLQGRSAILAEQRNNNFLDVACGQGAMVR